MGKITVLTRKNIKGSELDVAAFAITWSTVDRNRTF